LKDFFLKLSFGCFKGWIVGVFFFLFFMVLVRNLRTVNPNVCICRESKRIKLGVGTCSTNPIAIGNSIRSKVDATEMPPTAARLDIFTCCVALHHVEKRWISVAGSLWQVTRKAQIGWPALQRINKSSNLWISRWIAKSPIC
jgi:hypothetical protein